MALAFLTGKHHADYIAKKKVLLDKTKDLRKDSYTSGEDIDDADHLGETKKLEQAIWSYCHAFLAKHVLERDGSPGWKTLLATHKLHSKTGYAVKKVSDGDKAELKRNEEALTSRVKAYIEGVRENPGEARVGKGSANIGRWKTWVASSYGLVYDYKGCDDKQSLLLALDAGGLVPGMLGAHMAEQNVLNSRSAAWQLQGRDPYRVNDAEINQFVHSQQSSGNPLVQGYGWYGYGPGYAPEGSTLSVANGGADFSALLVVIVAALVMLCGLMCLVVNAVVAVGCHRLGASQARAQQKAEEYEAVDRVEQV